MVIAFGLIDVEAIDNARCVRLRNCHLDELQINYLADELLEASKAHDCTRLILCFDGKPIECLYSVFLAKLLSLQRILTDKGCCLIISELHPVARSVFDACKIAGYFVFTDSVEEALGMTLPDPLPGKRQVSQLK